MVRVFFPFFLLKVVGRMSGNNQPIGYITYPINIIFVYNFNSNPDNSCKGRYRRFVSLLDGSLSLLWMSWTCRWAHQVHRFYCHNRPLVCMLFGSAAWKTKVMRFFIWMESIDASGEFAANDKQYPVFGSSMGCGSQLFQFHSWCLLETTIQWLAKHGSIWFWLKPLWIDLGLWACVIWL